MARNVEIKARVSDFKSSVMSHNNVRRDVDSGRLLIGANTNG